MAITTNSSPRFYMPAEWHPQSGVQLTWPHEGTDWKPYMDDIVKVFVSLTHAIARYEKVLIVAQNVEEVKTLLRDNPDKENLHNIQFYQCATNDTWARDHAGITLTATDTRNGFHYRNMILDFRFNGWGRKFEADKDNAITRRLYFDGMLLAALEDHHEFVLEGGSIESDGEGTIFTTSQCLLAPNRNQPMNRQEIEEKLKETLRAKRIVWLDHGTLTGDDTDGHIDTIVRTAPHHTLVYVGCDDQTDEQYEDFKALEKQLKELNTLAGKPYKLLRLPMPDPLYDGKDRLPATYANYLIINGAVICPTYNQPQKDREAMDVIREAYPGRELIGMDARTVIRQHGSIHCLTMQFPQGVIR